MDHQCFVEIMWVAHKHCCSVCALVIVLYIVIVNHLLTLISKSFVGLKTGYKRIHIATLHIMNNVCSLVIM